MECSVEISMYPLNSDYKPAIIDFIKRLRKHLSLVLKQTV